MSGDVRPKVLYIAGWQRSGTTLMDNLLGAHDGVFTAGEVSYLWQQSFLDGRKCGCGTPLLDCYLWKGVFANAFGGSPPDPERMIALQKKAVGVHHTPALVAATRTGRVDPAAREYADILSQLYRAIAEETGCRVIVDASKRPSDAVATAMAGGVDAYLLHMVRDPRACAFSWRRHVPELDSAVPSEMHRHGILMNAGHWVSWNVASELAGRAFPGKARLLVRYEDFMTEPKATVERIFAHLDEPIVGDPFVGRSTVRLPTNHTIAGNPKRFLTGDVRIRLDDEWQAAQPPVDRHTTTALALPLLRRYGYPVVVKDDQPQANTPA